jgi:sulfite reductase beta subunit-like hemoprotein
MATITTAIETTIGAEYDATVREDIEIFRQAAEAYLAGQLTDDQFRAQRLRRGVYGQRQPGVHMIRTKVPGGILTAAQLGQLARVADEFGGGRAHLTTRQNVQFHFVPLPRVAPLLHLLADVRLTTREACYNTVRNVTACPTAGLLPDEIFNVTPYARRTAFAFLHKELTDSMPRKFKIAFCGCAQDCMLGAIHDVGLRAVIREGRRGFRMVIGGGLGPLPTEAIVLDEFVPEEDLIRRIEAMLRVFNKYGNRGNKNKARFKFIVRERGADWTRDAIAREYAEVGVEGGIATPGTVPDGFGGFQVEPQPFGTGRELPVLNGEPSDPGYQPWLDTNVREQRQAGYSMVTVTVPQGNLTGDQMRAIGSVARTAGDGLVRVNIAQNLHLGFIEKSNLPRVFEALGRIGLAGGGAGEISDITTCPGAYSCNLALTKAMTLGAALSDVVREYDDPLVRRLSIKISGCPNSCGQHWISDLGFYGNSRKIEGREVPYYLMLLGGGYEPEGVIRFGLAISSVPARLAPEAVRRVIEHYLAHRQPDETFRAYVLRNRVERFRAMVADLIKPADYTPELFRDWGDEVDYSLQLGRGECAS